MLTVIEKLLDASEIAQFRQRLAAATWIDGAQSAGSRSASVMSSMLSGSV